MEKDRVMKEITPKGQDYSQWYLDVVLKAELADYGPVKGCMVIRPYGYAIWENMQADMDRRIKETGHVNAYFPLLIPKSFLEKEKQHVEGFSPECAWVTIGGGEELHEPLAIRPTSEAHDLLDVREVGELLARPADPDQPVGERGALGEGDAAVPAHHRVPLAGRPHAPRDRGRGRGRDPQDAAASIAASPRRRSRCPCCSGARPRARSSPARSRTYAIEALMGDGKALQAGTSHNLGQHFAKAYGIEFLDRNQERLLPWSTSWGTSTRMIGGLIMTHGDDSGLILPPKVAPYQVVIVPIPPRKGDVNEAVLPKCREVQAALRGAGIRVHLDDRDTQLPGFKYADWEMRGVPIRMEIGPKDLEKDQCVLVRRDTREKAFVPLAGPAAAVARAARGDAAGPAGARTEVRGRQHSARRELRRVQADHGREPRLHRRRLVRRCGLRGQDQGRDAGHDPRDPDRRRAGRGLLHPLRQAVARGGLFRAGLLKTKLVIDRSCIQWRPVAGLPASSCA